jgi:predicted nicotinamide N-methyase
VEASYLDWGDNRPLGGELFDYCITSDCVYNYDAHQSLLSILRKLLKPNGVRIVRVMTVSACVHNANALY